MAFALPSFPLVFQAKANFNFALGANPVGPFILPNTPCNLVYSHRVHNSNQAVALTSFTECMYLLFPDLVALKGRSSYALAWGDAVDVPSGSGRWYSVVNVDWVANGFANAHRCAMIVQPKNLSVLAPLWP